MKTIYGVIGILACTFVAACSHTSGRSLTAPTEALVTPSTANSVMSAKSLTTGSGVVFSTAEAGKVTITNQDDRAHRFAFYVWDATNEENQQLMARIQQSIAPGQTAVLTVAFYQACSAKYQRDVYLDIQNYEGATSEAETRNFFYAAPGVYWQSEAGKCDVVVTPPIVTPPTTPPVTPPVVETPVVPPPPPPALCTDVEANNYGQPLPCTYNPPPPLCGDYVFSGPFDIDAGNGAPALLTTARLYVPGVNRVHPSHGGVFGGNNNNGFTFTPSEDFAVIIFHQSGGGHSALDRLYTGVSAGVPLSVLSNGGDIFYFNCVAQ